MGRFAINNLNLNFDKAEKTISAQISDYMCFLDGTLGGTLQHKITIHEDTPIQEALKTILTKLVKYSIENITIEDTELKIPYKIEKMPGSTIYELLKEIMELYMGWEYFFDAHGYLVIQKIKDKRLAFDERFGLGTKLKRGEEEIFIQDLIKNGLWGVFYPIYIVKHPFESTGTKPMKESFRYFFKGAFSERLGLQLNQLNFNNFIRCIKNRIFMQAGRFYILFTQKTKL